MKDNSKRIKWTVFDNIFDRAVIVAFADGEITMRSLKDLSSIGANMEAKKLMALGIGRARNLAQQAVNKRQWKRMNSGEELTGKHAKRIQATKEKRED